MKDFHYDEDNVSINPETYKSAKDYFNLFREKGIHWKEMSNIKKTCAYLQWLLQNVQETNLMDIEDVLLEMYMKVHRHGTIRDFSEMAVDAITRGGSSIKTDASPVFTELVGHMNNDDLQSDGADLGVTNDMSAVSTPDAGPGSDLHIAKIDIRDHLGEKFLDVFEAMQAGAGKREIETAFGYSYEEVRWCEQRVCEFLKRGEYTLDGTNRRIGSSREFDSGKSFFPASRKTKRTWNLPEVDHRSTSYVDFVEFDNTPVPPCGDELKPSVLVFDNGTPAADLRRSVALLDANSGGEVVKTANWDDHPNGHDEKLGTATSHGDPSTWKPFANTAYGISLYNTIPGVEKIPVPRDADMEKCEKWWAAERRVKENEKNSGT